MKRGKETDNTEEASGEASNDDGRRIGVQQIDQELKSVGAHGEEECREAHKNEANATE